MPPYQVKHLPTAGAHGLGNLRPGQVSDLPTELHGKLFGKHFKRYGVHDDGSCFFHTVCAALNLSSYRSKSPERQERIGRQFRRLLRKEVSQQNWDRVWEERRVSNRSNLPSLAKIKEMLGNYKTWADVYMIVYCMDRLNLNMLFFDASSDQLYCGVRGLKSTNQDTVFVLWVNHAHFEPICRLDGSDQYTFKYSKNDPDSQRLMKMYHGELCTGQNDDINMLV
jgi:hypothetical protein